MSDISKYRQSEEAAWNLLDAERQATERLREQVAAQAAVIEKLRDAFVHIQEYWNGDANEGAMFDALTHIENVAHESLAIPTDSTTSPLEIEL